MNSLTALVKLAIKQNNLLVEIVSLIQKLGSAKKENVVQDVTWMDRQQVWEKYHIGAKTLRRRTKEGIIPDTTIKGKIYYKE